MKNKILFKLRYLHCVKNIWRHIMVQCKPLTWASESDCANVLMTLHFSTPCCFSSWVHASSSGGGTTHFLLSSQSTSSSKKSSALHELPNITWLSVCTMRWEEVTIGPWILKGKSSVQVRLALSQRPDFCWFLVLEKQQKWGRCDKAR